MASTASSRKNRKHVETRLAAGAVVLATIIDGLTGTYHAMLLVLGLIGVVTVRAERSNKRFHADLRASLAHDWRQSQQWSTLVQVLRPVAPLPPARDWAASPDFLSLVASEVLRRQPAVVVEASCGLSTLVVGYLLKAQREAGLPGRCVSLEENAAYAAACREQVALHGLSDVVEVIHAPVSGEAGDVWYSDLSAVQGLTIDLLVVDGPSPAGEGSLPRAPALQKLQSQLADNVVIILDDGARETEHQTVAQWTAEQPSLRSEYLPLEKGAWRLVRDLHSQQA